MKRSLFALPLVAVIALAGCSQVAAIAPVGGDHLTEVRFATIDVLQQKGVALEAVPTCTADEGAVSCAGSTASGDDITATSPADDPDSFTVVVGSETIFTGSVSAVIDQAAGVTP